MKDLKFSVAMCVYGKDNPEWFKTAVDSIIEQTKKPDEIVLVVDGPVPEELGSIIEEYEKLDFFKVVRFEINQGHGNARRAGLENCSNELVAIMDSDDISTPDRFEKQLDAFEKDCELAIVGGNITEFVGEPDNIIGRRTVFVDDAEIKSDLKGRCPMNLVTVMFKKSKVEEAGGFIDWFCEEDYYLWLRMALADMRFANVSDDLVNVRVGKEMYRRRGGMKYFKSEAKLQGFMLKNKLISFPRYMINVNKRLIVQVLMPNKLRGWVFKKFARKTV